MATSQSEFKREPLTDPKKNFINSVRRMIGIPLLPQKLSARWTVETKQDLDAYTSMDDDILLEKALDELIKGM
jgi:hypothetical protein